MTHSASALSNLSAWRDASKLAQDGEIDFQSALERLGRNVELYMRVARKFIDSVDGSLAALHRSLASNARGEVALCLHTLKGLTATVGLRGASECAAQLERLVKSDGDADAVMQGVKRLQQMLSRGVAVLAAHHADFVQTQHVAESGPGFDRRAARERLTELHALLSDANMRALSVFERMLHDYGAAFAGEAECLRAAVENLDFKLAQECCAQLQEALADAERAH